MNRKLYANLSARTTNRILSEGQRFWDLRRWKNSGKIDEPFLCWNIEGASVEEFFKSSTTQHDINESFL